MRLVIGGSQPSSRKAIGLLLQTRLGIEVVGETGDINKLKRMVDAFTPDLVLIDGDFPNVDINELIASLRGLHFYPSVIILNNDPETESAGIYAGADAFIDRSSPPKQLLIAIKKVCFERGQL